MRGASLIVHNFIIDRLPRIYIRIHEAAGVVLSGLLDASWASAAARALIPQTSVPAHGPEKEPNNDEDGKDLHKTEAHSYKVPT